MKIVFFANGVRGYKCFEELLETNEDIIAVVGHAGPQSDVVKLARKKGISTYQPNNVNCPKFVETASLFKADLFILAGYNQIIKSPIINLPSIGCINLHGGSLPEYRGTAPINWQIINGEQKGGCCILFVDEGIDTGDIIVQEYYEILESDTSLDIVNKQLQLFPKMLLKVVQDFKTGNIKATVQDKNKGCYYTRRYQRDGIIKWEKMTGSQIYNLVRALADPYPNAFTFFNDRKIRIRKVEKIFPKIVGIPGRLSLKRKEGIIISCKEESLLVTEVAYDDDGIPFNPSTEFKIGIDFG